MYRWIKMEGNKFDNAKLKILQHSKPTLEEILHSDFQPDDIYLERNYLLTMTNKPIHDCSKKCFTMSACDMFEYEFDTKTCKMLPHLSLKDEVWTNFAVSTNDRKFAIFLSPGFFQILPELLLLKKKFETSFKRPNIQLH